MSKGKTAGEYWDMCDGVAEEDSGEVTEEEVDTALSELVEMGLVAKIGDRYYLSASLN